MSPIGRVFVVINLILSVVFVAFTGSLLQKGESFKKLLEEEQGLHEQTRQERTAQVQEWTAKYNVARADLDTAKNAEESLSNRNKVLEQEIQELKKRAEENRANLDKISRTLGDFNQNLENSRRELKALGDRETAAVSAKERAENEKLRLEDRAIGLERDIQTLEEKIGGHETTIAHLETQILSLDAQLKMATAAGFKIPKPQQDLEAIVERVDHGTKTIILSVGSDQGVDIGYTFHVFQGQSYKGRVRVHQVDSKTSLARIELAHPDHTIVHGDRAVTRF